MTSRCVWFYLFMVFDSTADHVASFTIREVILPSTAYQLDVDKSVRTKRHTQKQTSPSIRALVSQGTLGQSLLDSVINSTTEETRRATKQLSLVKPVPTNPHSGPIRECTPCSIWQKNSRPDDKDKLNLTILPFAAIFMFLVCLVIKCTHWCNEDIRLADAGHMKISVPRNSSAIGLSRSSVVSGRSSLQGRGSRRQSNMSVNTKGRFAVSPSVSEDQTSVTNEGTSSEDVRLDRHKKPVPTAATAAMAAKGFRRNMSQSRNERRCLRQQSLNSSTSTLNSLTSSRTASVKGHGGRHRREECSSSSTIGTVPGGDVDGEPLISHSASSDISFACGKLNFRTHFLSPPTLRLQISSGETSTTSLGESLPSLASRPSMCDSTCTEQIILSQEQEMGDNRDDNPNVDGGFTREDTIPDGLCQSGSYFEDPLVIECQFLTADETDPQVLLFPSSQMCDSGNTSLGDSPTSCLLLNKNSFCPGTPAAENLTRAILAPSPNSEDAGRNQENTHHGAPNRDTSDNDLGIGPCVNQALDPAVYYKLSTDCSASTESLNTPGTPTSRDANSPRSVDQSVPPENGTKSSLASVSEVRRPSRFSGASRDRISTNGFVPRSRVQKRKVSRSWCLGDKASEIYDKLRRGFIENDYNL